MGVKNSIKLIPLTTIASSTLSASYQAINPAGLPESCYLLKINNFSNQIISVSLDGTTEHEQVYNGTTDDLRGGTDSGQPNNNIALWEKGQVFYVKGTAGTGTISLAGFYQPRSV